MPYYPPNSGSGALQTPTVSLTVDTTTTSTTYVTLLTLVVGTSGNSSLLLQASFSTSDSASQNTGNFFRVTVDGTVYGYAGAEIFTCIQSGGICQKTGVLTAGSHTVTLDWHTSTGNTLRCRPATQAEQAYLSAIEVTV
jgi:hypothetical protein